MSDPVPAIAEASATGAVAEIFADIRTVLGVEVVNRSGASSRQFRMRCPGPGECCGRFMPTARSAPKRRLCTHGSRFRTRI